jgi:5'-nucleotidase/UDP-sugar diphosphatase
MNTHAVDLVPSGHNHDLHIDFDGRTALVEYDQDANYVTIVDIDVAPSQCDINRSLSWWPNFRVVDTAKTSPDPAMLAKVQMYSAGSNRLFDVEIATLAAPLDNRTEAVRMAGKGQRAKLQVIRRITIVDTSAFHRCHLSRLSNH